MWTFKIFSQKISPKKGNKFMLIPGPSFLVLRVLWVKKDKIKRPWKFGIEKNQWRKKLQHVNVQATSP